MFNFFLDYSMSKQELIIHKKGVFGKTIFKVTNKHNITYIVKASNRSLMHELKIYQLMEKLLISHFFAQIYNCEKKGNKYICFSEYIEDSLHTFYKKIKKSDRKIFWKNLFKQLIYVVSILEKNHIQHNDFHLGNLRIHGCDANNFQIKIIDLETMADYKNKKVPKELINATKKEKIRMGWDKKFHVGSDLNQILGQIIDEYSRDLPKSIVNKFKPLIISDKNKEFPFAVIKNNKMEAQKLL